MLGVEARRPSHSRSKAEHLNEAHGAARDRLVGESGLVGPTGQIALPMADVGEVQKTSGRANIRISARPRSLFYPGPAR